MTSEKHIIFMKRALEIAKLGFGTTRPNPAVGAVIVRDGRIIGEGYTSPYGGAHAEVIAISSVEDKSLLKDSILYVTLEPCSHYGKTPPCSDLIIETGIPKIVIGCVDDNPEVSGNGIKKLRDAHCEVYVGCLEKECKDHHKRFFTFHNKKRPYIILKWAQTADGFIAPKHKSEKKPIWITNQYSRQLVHKWRSEEQAILVGTNTVFEDNPDLTARSWKGLNPTRIVLDQHAELNNEFNIFNMEAETIVIDKKAIDWSKHNEIATQICTLIYKSNINSVIIEGGSKTLHTFINEGLWDEARVFYGNSTFKKGVLAPKFKGQFISEKTIESDILKIYANN